MRLWLAESWPHPLSPGCPARAHVLLPASRQVRGHGCQEGAVRWAEGGLNQVRGRSCFALQRDQQLRWSTMLACHQLPTVIGSRKAQHHLSRISGPMFIACVCHRPFVYHVSRLLAPTRTDEHLNTCPHPLSFLQLPTQMPRNGKKNQAKKAKESKDEGLPSGLRARAEQGEADALIFLANCYSEGRGVEQDHVEAARLYRLAADQGLPSAAFCLGFCYKEGKGVEQDSREAVRWLRSASEKGLAPAQHCLGLCYRGGEGVVQDDKEAVRWIRAAAEQGYAGAQAQLGICYSMGAGVAQDIKEAFRWLSASAAQNNKDGLFALAAVYQSGGRGVPRNLQEAARLYRLASDQGDVVASAMLANLRSSESEPGQDKDLVEAHGLRKKVRQGLRKHQDVSDDTAVVEELLKMMLPESLRTCYAPGCEVVEAVQDIKRKVRRVATL